MKKSNLKAVVAVAIINSFVISLISSLADSRSRSDLAAQMSGVLPKSTSLKLGGGNTMHGMNILRILIFFMATFNAFAGDRNLGAEQIPANEAEAIQRTNEIMEDFLQNQYGNAIAGDVKRAIHPKMHGVVRATMVVNNRLPDWAKAGLFQEGAEYKAWIRLSNASSFSQPDSKGDARGMAIKVLGVKGSRILPEDVDGYSQDFTINSFPIFFAKDAWSYLKFIESFMIKKSFLSYLFPSINPLSWRLREAKILKNTGDVKASSPLNLEYYSMSPFRHGTDEAVAVKYRVRPVGGVKEIEFDPTDENYLKKALIEELRHGEVRLEFSIQRQVDADKMPIEDPTRRWSEKLSPFVPVATIIIPQQLFDTPEQIQFGENLTFNPWQGLSDHRPLGGINRLRLCSYLLSNKIRHQLNRAPTKEPSIDGSF